MPGAGASDPRGTPMTGRHADPIAPPQDWLSDPARFHGEWQGGTLGAGICIIANRIDGAGGGPRLHRHPYAETIVVRSGTGRFTLGDRQVVLCAGHILVIPPGTPHKFSNIGPEPLETIDIHENGAFITEWLE
jgi:mannose-6-phosphate isomerase-like protein (cupin superfamily)